MTPGDRAGATRPECPERADGTQQGLNTFDRHRSSKPTADRVAVLTRLAGRGDDLAGARVLVPLRARVADDQAERAVERGCRISAAMRARDAGADVRVVELPPGVDSLSEPELGGRCVDWRATKARAREQAEQAWSSATPLDEHVALDLAEFEREVGSFEATEEPMATTTSELDDCQTIIVRPADHADVAGMFAYHVHTRGGDRTLLRADDEFHEWRGSHWERVSDSTLRVGLWRFLKRAYRRTEGGRLQWVTAKQSIVSGALDALAEAATPTTGPVVRGDWIEWMPGDPPASEVVACANGLLHVPTRRLLDPTPRLFNVSASLARFDPDAACPTWRRFLTDLWGADDADEARALAEVCGLLLTPDASYHVIPCITGPSRSGKGTIRAVFTDLVGPSACTALSMGSFGWTFGLATLIGKSVAVVPDLRVDHRSDSALAVERLLSISGQDVVNVPRKRRDDWCGVLPVRLVLMGHDLPALGDGGGHLASRLHVIRTREPIPVERRDRHLVDRLRAELDGILLWALDGLDRLRERGHLVEPSSSSATRGRWADAADPIGRFVAERCVSDPSASVSKAKLHADYQSWAEDRGAPMLDEATFAKALLATAPGITDARRGGRRNRAYTWVGLGVRE